MESNNRPSSSAVIDVDHLRRMVGPDPHRPGRARGRLLEESVPVWAIIGYIGAIAGSTEAEAITDDVIAEAAEAYDVSREAVQAALLYYEENRCPIDTLLETNAAALE